jgi:hypothetical protein
MKPQGYSHTDSAEILAIQLVERLLNPDRVKSHLQRRDKIPNTDGIIELVADDGVPKGKMEVQVRTIDPGSHKASCPVSLIAYSQITTLPVLFVGADTKNGKVFWRHIEPSLEPNKTNQKSLTIHFNPQIDQIAEDSPYLSRWTEICEDYQRRIASLPTLEETFDRQVTLAAFDPALRTAAQEFIDAINHGLDHDYPILKHVFFADAAKLGLALDHVQEKSSAYAFYKIPKGQVAPTLVHLPGTYEKLQAMRVNPGKLTDDPLPQAPEVHGAPVFQWHWENGSQPFQDEPANKFFAQHWKTAIEKRLLNIAGDLLSREQVFHFIDRHAHALGLAQSDQYEVAALEQGLHLYFPHWYNLAFGNFLKKEAEWVGKWGIPPFSALASRSYAPPPDEVKRLQLAHHSIGRPLLRTDEFNFKSLSQAIRWLADSEISVITRPYPRRVSSPNVKFIWDGFSRESMAERVRVIVEGALESYDYFLSCNGLDKLSSAYSRRNKLTVVWADLSKWSGDDLHRVPVLNYLQADTDSGESGLYFFDQAPSSDQFSLNDTHFVWNKSRHAVVRTGSMVADFIFQPLPHLKIVYAWLAQDLADRGLDLPKHWTLP